MSDELPEGWTDAACPHCGGTGKAIDRKAFGAQMQSLRKSLGKRLRDISDLTGFSVSYISDLEKGRRNWSKGMTRAYLKALDAETAIQNAGVFTSGQKAAE